MCPRQKLANRSKKFLNPSKNYEIPNRSRNFGKTIEKLFGRLNLVFTKLFAQKVFEHFFSEEYFSKNWLFQCFISCSLFSLAFLGFPFDFCKRRISRNTLELSPQAPKFLPLSIFSVSTPASFSIVLPTTFKNLSNNLVIKFWSQTFWFSSGHVFGGPGGLRKAREAGRINFLQISSKSVTNHDNKM